MIKSVGISASSNGRSDDSLLEASRRIEEAGADIGEIKSGVEYSSKMNYRLSWAAVLGGEFFSANCASVPLVHLLG